MALSQTESMIRTFFTSTRRTHIIVPSLALTICMFTTPDNQHMYMYMDNILGVQRLTIALLKLRLLSWYLYLQGMFHTRPGLHQVGNVFVDTHNKKLHLDQVQYQRDMFDREHLANWNTRRLNNHMKLLKDLAAHEMLQYIHKYFIFYNLLFLSFSGIMINTMSFT